MSHLNKDTIKYLSQLCRITCSEEEQTVLLNDLKKIVDYVEQLQALDTEGIEPCIHVMEGVNNALRDDIVRPGMTREEFLSNVPSQISGMVRVPTIIKQP